MKADRVTGPLRVLQLSIMEGANYYSGSPIVVLRLDLGEYDEVFTSAIDGFLPALKSHLPSLQEHHCSPGHPGGFFERVTEGTLLGHVTEHVAIELQTLAGMDVGFGKTRATRVPGVYNVVYRFEEEAAGQEAGRMAVGLVNSILTGGAFDVSGSVQRLREMWAAHRPDSFTRNILREAKRRRIPVQRMAESGLLILGTGARQKRIGGGLHSHSGALGHALAKDPERWMGLLAEAEVPVAPYAVVNSPVKAAEFQARRKCPVRVLSVGNQVRPEVEFSSLFSDVTEISNAFREAAQKNGRAVIQAVPDGEWWEVFVVEGQALNVERFSGSSAEESGPGFEPSPGETYAALSKTAVRAARWIGLDAARVTVLVPTDADSRPLVLDIQPAGASLPKLGAESGAKAARLVLDGLFPEGASSQIRLIGITGSRGVSRLAERLVSFFRASGVNTGWVDLDGRAFFPDWDGVGNLTGENPPRPPFKKGGGKAGLPSSDVAPTSSKEMAGRPFLEDRKEPGTSGTVPETAGPTSEREKLGADLAAVQRLLREPDLEAAVVPVPPERILRDGLPYDWAEVGVVLNVGDMPGEYDYLHNADDFAHALCVVPEKVLATGLAVLNADDPHVLKMAGRAKGRVILFSADYHNEAMRSHADRGGASVVLDGDEIVVLRGRERIRLIGGILGNESADGDPCIAIAPPDREVLLAFVAVLWGLGLVNGKGGSVDIAGFW
jgi:cyanophycin synthetase